MLTLRRPAVLWQLARFAVVGGRAYVTLPIDAVPDITNVQVQVLTAAPRCA